MSLNKGYSKQYTSKYTIYIINLYKIIETEKSIDHNKVEGNRPILYWFSWKSIFCSISTMNPAISGYIQSTPD